MRPYHVAIVGSGPSGFFAASSLLKARRRAEESMSPSTCWRCCPPRGGWCAPASRPITRRSSRSASNSRRPPQDPRFRFFGNVSVGEHVQADRTRRALRRRRLCGRGAIRPCAEHPRRGPAGQHRRRRFRGLVQRAPELRGDDARPVGGRAVVVGNGNVALDVARILVTDPDVLARPTSPTTRWSRCARAASTRWWSSVGAARCRPRSPRWSCASWATWRYVDVIVDPADFEGISDEDAPRPARPRSRTSTCSAVTRSATAPRPPPHRAALHDLPDRDQGRRRVEAIVLGRNELVTDDSGRVSAKDTGEREELPVQLVVAPVGYRGVPTPGCRSTTRPGPFPTPTAGSRAAATNTSSAGSSAGRPA